ncbi:MAG: molybdopterin-dependent oxidoreductase [Planctomycetota bacterium]|nr:molybdopterin-dependent oxidoreductase [Planctomycetota bacterium]
MPITPVTCPLDCPDACGMLVESDASGRFIALRGNPAHGYSRGVLCGKTAIYGDLLQSRERLLTPLVRRGKKSSSPLEPASWDEALARIVERVAPLRAEPHRILALWYAGNMGRVQRFFPMRMMNALGATNVDGGLCDNTSTAGYECVFGGAYGTDLEQLDDKDFVLLWGCDMVRTVQHLQPAVQRLAKSGVPVVAIDIYRTDTIEAIERWGGRGVIVRPGTDAALALGVARLAFERGYTDSKFLAERCLGAEVFEAHVRSGHDLAWTARTTGVSERDISALADLLGRSSNFLLKTGVGFGRRRVGGMSMRAIASLVALFGHPECMHYESYSNFQLDDATIERPDLRPAGARADVIKHVQVGRELESGRFGAVFTWGHNPAVTVPESRRVRAGLARDDVFYVVHDSFLTETAELADVVLPATMAMENDDLYRSYGHRRLQRSRKACDAPAGPLCNVDTFARIAKALGLPRETWDVTSVGLVDDLIRASSRPLSSEQLAALDRGEPVKMEQPRLEGPGTPSGKIELVSNAAAAAGQPALATYVPDDGAGGRGRFGLICAPSIHTHNSTFSHSPRHLKRRGLARVWLNPTDASTLGLSADELAVLSNEQASLSLPVGLDPRLPAGLARVDGLPKSSDTPERLGINALVPGTVTDLGDGNSLYSTRIDIRRSSSS